MDNRACSITNFISLLLLVAAGVVGCSNPDTKKTVQTAADAKKPVFMQPFTYHKTIEVSPGQYYDILSWGRGSSTIGAFEILRSDSAGMKYTTTTGDLDGRIVDVLNTDMDSDGNPELYIQTQAGDSTNANKVFAFEYKDAQARQLDFPNLTRSQRKGYKGNDNFYIKDDKLMREFVIFENDSANAKPTAQKRLIEYNLRGNNLSANQVSKDSVQTEQTPAITRSMTNAGSGDDNEKVERKSSRRKSVKKKTSTRKKQSQKKRRKRRN